MRIPFIFPEKGKNDNVNYPAQPPDSSSDLSNVRAFDSILGRRRGGSRPGLSKWWYNTLSGANRIQALIKAVEAQPVPGSGVARTLGYGTTNTATGSFNWIVLDDDDAVLFNINGTSGQGVVHSAAGNFYISGVIAGDTVRKYNSASVEQWDNTTEGGGPIVFDAVNGMVVVSGPTGKEVHGLQDADGVRQWTFDAGEEVLTIVDGGDGYVYVCCESNSAYTGAGATKSVFKLDASDGSIAASWDSDNTQGATEIRLAVGPQGQVVVTNPVASSSHDDNDGTLANVFLLDADLNFLKKTIIEPAWVSGGGLTDRWVDFDEDGHIYVVDNLGWGTKLHGSTLNESWHKRLVGASGANAVRGIAHDRAGTLWVMGITRSDWRGLAGTWEGVKYNTRGQPQEGYDSDSGAVKYPLFRHSTASLATRVTSLVAVSNGEIVLIENGVLKTVTGGPGALVTTDYTVQLANAFSDVFFVDGTNVKVLDMATDTVTTWTATTAGTLPSLPRLICRWRGRIVVSGLVADPHNWFMSRVGDPYDWDYSPATTTAIIPTAGNIGEYGLAGDIITALCPFDDDTLVIGMDGSIGKFAGDPAAGGVIDVVTEKTGMAWDAWAMGPDNQMYFMGNDGIYQMGRDTIPVNITEGALDGAFENVDLKTKRVILEWDWRNRGLVVVIADQNSSTANEAYFLEARTDGWFPVAWPATMGPDVLVAYDGEVAGDRALLMGCRDGYIRQPDTSATDDDGTTLTSNVRLFPIGTRRGTDTRLQGLEVNLAENSGNVTLKLYSGQTAEQCAGSTTVRWSRVLKAGKNTLTLPRLRGAWLQIELTATSRWALESIFGLFEEGGRARRPRR